MSGADTDRRRRWILAAATTLVALLVVEIVCSWSLGSEGKKQTAADLRRQAAPELEIRESPDAIEPAESLNAEEVLHPYLGFVTDPAINDDPDRQRSALRVNDLGFFQQRPTGESPGTNPFRVAIFGGSVAFLFSFQGGEELAADVARMHSVAPRPVVVDSFALGGYRQPQSLHALVLLLSQGYRPDMVLVIDGFNELVGAQENTDLGVDPSYPRDWPQRVATVLSPRRQELLAALAAARRNRWRLARRFDVPLLRRSGAWLRLWSTLDRKPAVEASEIVAELTRLGASESQGYRLQGPGVRDGTDPLRAAADLWERSSRLMHQICAANGIAYAHFLQPNQYVPGSKAFTPEERRRAVSPGRWLVPVVRRGYPLLQEAGRRLRAEGVAFYDLTSIFENVESTIYNDDCCHFNREGNAVMAGAIAERLASSDLLEERGTAATAP